jgi:GT2 family glycosyltransferase/glycosyltransferase involved in cell wall biosynthesis
MPIVQISSQGQLEHDIKKTGPALLAVPVFNALDEAIACLKSILAHSSKNVEILVIDDGSTDPRLPELLDALGPLSARIVLWVRPENLGFVRTMNLAFRVAGRRDVVVINSDVIVGAEWLQRLKIAAYSDQRIATATPLTNHGSILSVPKGQPTREVPAGHTPQSAAAAVAKGSMRLYPKIPVCVGHLIYIRRSALDLAGWFDEAFSPGYSEEIDFSLRCASLGLLHVCADDVFVYHAGSASFGSDQTADRHRRRGHDLIAERYPFYYPWIETIAASTDTPLACAIASGAIALRGLHLLVDATCLGPELRNGTQRATMEVLRALARHASVSRLVALIANPLAAKNIQEQLPANCQIEFVTGKDLTQDFKKVDVAFRPFQVHGSSHELRRLRAAARRAIVWQLDFISYDNPFYHQDRNRWQGLRDLTRLTLGTVDGIALSSEYVLKQACEYGLVPPSTIRRVIYPGTDHFREDTPSMKPTALPPYKRNYILSFGTDYSHKNRAFAMRMFGAMRNIGYAGALLMAGSHVRHGSSRDAEETILLSDRSLGEHVLNLSAVSEPERTWLFRNADLIAYPSLAEGFGLIPFEAAASGVPCLSSRHGSLDEVLPKGIETINDWDPEEAAKIAMKLIGDPTARAKHIELIRERSSEFTWIRCADQIIDFALEVCHNVPSRVVALQGDEGNVVRVESQGRPIISLWVARLDSIAKSLATPPRGLWIPVRVARRLLRTPYKALVRYARKG